MKYVIIGNSTAAVGCIEGIRKVDNKGEIIVISSEEQHTYSRPLISYLLCGKTTLEKMKYRPDDFYKKNNCETVFGSEVTKILPEEKAVVLYNGEKVGYDKLMIATGSVPFVPPFAGLDKVEKKTCFGSLDNALTLESMIDANSRVLIVGAGLIGLKCAEGIADSVASITICDLATRILPSVLDEEGSRIVQTHLEKHNIKFYLGDSVKEFEKNSALLNSGTKVDFDVVVLAVGVRPNIGLVKDAGLKVNRGMLTDEYCRTSIPDVYAAGDCAESIDSTTDQSKVIAILPVAYARGNCAGVNMAGGDENADDAFPINSVGFFDLHMVTAGSYEGSDYVLRTDDNYKRLIVKDNLLKGFIIVGNIERAGIYTAMIREKTPLDSLDFDMIAAKPQLMAMSSDERVKILRGNLS